MTSEPQQDTFITEDDLTTTVPNIKSDKWSMPAPIFRKTSGRLPESFVKKAAAENPVETSLAPDSQTSTSAVEPRPKSPTLKIVIVVLALVAMVAFIAVFLTVVYFMFLR